MAKDLNEDFLSYYQQDYFECDFEENGEGGPKLFEIRLEQCRSFFQIAVRQAYIDYRCKKDTGKTKFISILAGLFLSDKQLGNQLGKAKKLLPSDKQGLSGKREIAYALNGVKATGKAKLTWKQLVGLVNELLKVTGEPSQIFKDAAIFEEYRLSLELKKFQKNHSEIAGEVFEPSTYEKYQAALPNIEDEKLFKKVNELIAKYDGAQNAIANKERVFGVVPTDKWAVLRIQELEAACYTWMYNQGYSVATIDKWRRDKKNVDTSVYDDRELNTYDEDIPVAPGRTEFLARATSNDIPLIEQYLKDMGSTSVDSFDENVKEDINKLLLALKDDGSRPQIAVPLEIDSVTGAGLFLVDTESVNSPIAIRSRYCFVVAPYESSDAILMGKSRHSYEVFSANAKEDAYQYYSALVNGELEEGDLAAEYFADINDGYLLNCPARYKRFFNET